MLKPATSAAYALLHEGAIAFAQIEEVGIQIDMGMLKSTIATVQAQIQELEKRLRGSREWQVWAKRYGSRMSLGNHEQLGKVIFNSLGYERNPQMYDRKKQKHRNDVHAFAHLDIPFVTDYFDCARLKKALSTYLYGVQREVVDGRLHPFFGLHTAESYRGSSSRPNLQNFPVRNKLIAEAIRKCVVPSPGNLLLEADYSSQEVRVSCCYNQDPKLRDYICGGGDMHADMATKLFMVAPEEVLPSSWKLLRYLAKNRFVFPQFYGSYFAQCAPGLWEGIKDNKIRLTNKHGLFWTLRRQRNIRELGACDPEQEPVQGTFEYHVRTVERQMWDEVFTVYRDWKVRWWDKYRREGGVNTLTGFRMEGLFRKNQILCDPIQGCLPGHVKVLTLDGHLPIESLVGRCVEVWTGSKWAPAIAVSKGKWRQARVHLSSGIVLDCDTRHKFKNEYNEWTDFSSLVVGSYVALPRCLHSLTPSSITTAGIDWWFVFGFILGDGCLHRRKDSPETCGRVLTIVVGKKKRQLLIQIQKFMQEQGYKPARFCVPAKDGREEKYGLRLEDKIFAQFLSSFGFDWSWKSRTKRLPTKVWTASLQERRDFMEGLWLSDGNRGSSQKRNLHTPNKELLLEVQELIAPIGFDSSLSQTSTGWLLRVQERKFNAKPARKYPRKAVERIVDRVRPVCYEDQKEFNSDASAFYRKGGTLSQYRGERLIEKAGGEEIYRFDQVVKIEILEEVAETYTMSVDDPLHQFAAGGVICKNSAFHCMLLSIIKIQKEFRRCRLRSRIVNTVHDSLLIDTVPSELQDVVEIVRRITTVEVPRHWSWLTVPLVTEYEVSDRSWYDKKPLEVPA